MDARDTFRLTTVTAAVLAAISGIRGGARSAKPVSRSAPAGYATNDGRQFGQHNGINEGGLRAVRLYLNRRRRDGHLAALDGRDLGLESRQLRFEHNRQGNWSYFIEYGRIPRYEPCTVTTGVGGIGSSNLTVPATPTTGSSIDLKTRRDAVDWGSTRFCRPGGTSRCASATRRRDGARVFGRGTTGSAGFAGNFEFTPEPINSTTRQLEALVGDTPAKSSSFRAATTAPCSIITTTSSTSPVALRRWRLPPARPSPDRAAAGQQLPPALLSGGYGFTPTTRGTFKLSYAKAKQDDAFPTGAAVPLFPGVGNNLQGKVDTTLAQVGIVSRPIPKLTCARTTATRTATTRPPRSILHRELHLRWEERAALDPHDQGGVEAGYLLPGAVRLTGGIEAEEKKRNTSPYASSVFAKPRMRPPTASN